MVIRQILPLGYDRIRFVTDYEKTLMNAVRQIFPTSRLPATRNNPLCLCPNVCMLDGYNVIMEYTRQFPEIQVVMEQFL